jgi:hypothetical protein
VLLSRVLVLADADGPGTDALQAALVAAGDTVVEHTPDYTWDGTNPSPEGFDVAIHYDGSTFDQSLPVSAQKALEGFVAGGGGYIGFQFDGYKESQGQQVNMPDLVLQGYPGPDTSAGSPVTYNAVPVQAGHPVLAGVPSAFTFLADAESAGPLINFATQPSTVLMTTGRNSPAVIVRNFGAGHVMSMAAGPDFAGTATLQDPNIERLITNAVSWESPTLATFDSLAAPQIVYGTASVTLSGHVTVGASPAPGVVAVTLAGATQNATIDPSGWFSSTFATSTLDVASSPYTITYQYLGSNGLAPSSQTQTLRVTPAPLTVTPADASRAFGAANPIFTGTVVGLQNGDTVTALYSTTATPASDVGTYPITAALFDPGDRLANYTVTLNTGTLSVVPAAPSISLAGGTFIYDATPQAAVVSVQDAFGDNLGAPIVTYNGSTAVPINAGTYTVVASYAGSLDILPGSVSATLVISPRDLTVTAVSASKNYGDNDPAFSATGTGFAPGDGFGSLAGTLTFVTNEPPGIDAPARSYVITPSGLASPNYSITFQPGTLTVNPAGTSLSVPSSPVIILGTGTTTLSGTIASVSKALPVGEPVTVTITGPGVAPLSSTAVIQSDGSFTASFATSTLPVGNYSITFAYAGDQNLAGSSATATAAVTYQVDPLFNETQAHNPGSVIPIKIELTDAGDDGLSAPGLVVTALAVVGPNGATSAPVSPGQADPGGQFKVIGTGYRFNLETTGLAPGTYTLEFTIQNDPVTHSVVFVVG